MGVKEEYFELKEQWTRADGARKAEIDKRLDAFFNALSDEEKSLVNEAVTEDFARIHEKVADASELKREIEIRKIMADTLPFISVSQFSRTYFGKSASWLHQRINGNEVHGKVARFTKGELDTLAGALRDVASRLTKAAVDVAS
ncbi:MAG: DUF5053 domain-containing protein [Mediterranea sp.]|jgi:hypothetical protein|nr:DUF5053 domain-containing protein [Mediterranea sp.]